MSAVLAAVAGLGVFLIVAGNRAPALADRVAVYLRRPAREPAGDPAAPAVPSAARHAGLAWSAGSLRARRAAAMAAGAFVGLLLAQGDLFLAGPGRSLPGFAALGGATGALGFSMWMTRRRERRTELLRQELPVVADTVALHVVAGESVATALDMFTRAASGVAVDELSLALDRYREGRSLPEALQQATRETVHDDASRLYTLLGSAHETGGRLADGLAELARDYRAGLARDLTAEGGKRALAVYGPILALMIPVALLFLIYPTLTGLGDLSGAP